MPRKADMLNRKSQIAKCHLGFHLVNDHAQGQPFGDGHYYYGFEFCSEDDAHTLLDSQGTGSRAIRAYLKPYFQTPNIYSDVINETFDTDQVLQNKCDRCENTGTCAVEASFLKSLQLNLMMRYDACCIDRDRYDECAECRIWRKICLSDKFSKICIYDLRLLGHPTKVVIEYPYVRCIPKTRCLLSLSGIDRFSRRPVRFSYRLVQRINAALAENLRKTYIAEACAIPESTIYHWKCRELKRGAVVHSDVSTSTNFFMSQPVSAMYLQNTIHRRNFVFVIHKTEENTTLQAVYTKKDWDFMESVASGNPCKIPILSNSQMLNLAYDYLSCCTNIPPRVGAVILANIWCLLSDFHCRTDPLTDVLGNDYKLEAYEEVRRILDFSQRSWAVLKELIRAVQCSASELLAGVFHCLQAETDSTSEVEAAFSEFSAWYRKYTPQDAVNTIFWGSSDLYDHLYNQLYKLFMIADLSPLSWHEIIARLLYFNPAALPHKESAPSALEQYLFEEDGSFAAGRLNQVPFEELFRMVQAGLLKDDVIIPISEQLWPERFGHRDDDPIAREKRW